MIIRDGGTTNTPPGVPMSMSPEYPLDGGEHLSVSFSRDISFPFWTGAVGEGELLWSASVRIRNLPSAFRRTVFTCFAGKSFQTRSVRWPPSPTLSSP